MYKTLVVDVSCWCQMQRIFSCFFILRQILLSGFSVYKEILKYYIARRRTKHEKHFTWLSQLNSPRPAPLCTCVYWVPVIFHTAFNYSVKNIWQKFCSLFVACKSKTKRNSFNGAWRLWGVFPRTQLRIHVLLFAFCFSALMTVKFTRKKNYESKNRERSEKCFCVPSLLFFFHHDEMNQRSDPEPSK